MSWKRYEVPDHALSQLVSHNEPIPMGGADCPPNSGVELFSLQGQQINAIYDANIGAIRQLNGNNPIFPSLPNRDLLLYNDHLLNENITTVIVDGFFGTGKTSTLCSHLVPGLLQELQGENGIPMAYLSKPHESMGNSYGHLPGELEEKIAYEYQSFFQYFNRFGMPDLANILMMIQDERKKLNAPKGQKLSLNEPILHTLVFEYLRGLDIERGWVVLDETQNTNVKEASTFIARMCDDAKVILLGDSTITQIDKRGNNPENNGLIFAKNTYANTKYTGIVELRSKKHILRGQRTRDLFDAIT